ncbi:MAG TPA: glycine cleavage T C-terminal barrel domain-containing protein [Thermoanaerobaculia bacterium]|nr:glycine cleavage T C-terminal barrel domain-containing protein [Thermoanaerobaculia bacterium]
MSETNTPAPAAKPAAAGAPDAAATAVAAGTAAAGTSGAGQLSPEYAALRHGCGLVDRVAADRLEMLGADRQRFLNAYVTCEVKGLAAGQGAYGFFTSAQGRILADVMVLEHGDRLWLELPPGQADAITGHLRKYLIADRVEMRPLGDMVPLTLAGPGAPEALAGPAGIAPGLPLPREPWSHARAMVSGIEVTLQRRERLGVPALTLWVSASLAASLKEELLAWSGGAGGGLRPVGPEALEVVRTEAGIPRYGQDFGPQNFPQETGLDGAVSYTKGCYLGQEVVARIHYRGGVQKALCGLVFDGPAVPARGTALLYEGREAGTLGTAVHSPALDRPAGLAILHRRAAAPGSRLELADGGSGEVRALPLAAPAPGSSPSPPEGWEGDRGVAGGDPTKR